jgi:hypothetical protein
MNFVGCSVGHRRRDGHGARRNGVRERAWPRDGHRGRQATREGAYARGNVYTVSAFVTLLRESSLTARVSSRSDPLAGDVLHDRDGALADERDGHRMGAHAVARDAAGGVGGAQESGLRRLGGRPLRHGFSESTLLREQSDLSLSDQNIRSVAE